jgi:large repetitive protein
MAASSQHVITALAGGLLITGLGYLVFRPAQKPQGGAEAAPVAAEDAEADPRPGTPLAGVPSAASDQAALLAGSARLAVGSPASDPIKVEGPTFQVLGQLICAPGIPADEQARLRVYAGPDRESSDDWEGQSGMASGDLLGDEFSELTPPRAPQSGSGPGAGADSDLLAEVLVDAQGRFELILPESVADQVHLDLEASYLYLDRRLKFNPRVLPVQGLEVPVKLGARLAGVAMNGNGQSRIHIVPDPEGGFETTSIEELNWERTAREDLEGRFVVNAIPVSGRHFLLASAEGRAPLLREIDDLLAGSTKQLSIELFAGDDLRGRVVDIQGQPLPGVEITCEFTRRIARGLKDLARATSAEDGTFLLSNLPPQELRVRATLAGFLPQSETVSPAGRDRKDLELTLAEGAAILGRVVMDDGKPAADAEVKVRPDLGAMTMGSDMGRIAEHRARVRTDTQGGFKISGLSEAGRYILACTASSASGSSLRVRLAGVRAGGDEVLLRLLPSLNLAGRVIGPLGEPVQEGQIQLRLKGSGGVFGIGAYRRTESMRNPEGAISVPDLEPGTWLVSVQAPGYSANEPVEVALPQAPDQPLVIALQAAPCLSGRVLTPLGQPISGALVKEERGLFERIEQGDDETRGQAFTDASGGFEITDIDAGVIELVATRDGFASSEPLVVEAQGGQRHEGLVLTLRLGATVTGEVLDGAGQPLQDQTVILQRMPNLTRQVMLTSDSQGRFVKEHLEPGTWQVMSMRGLFGSGVDPEDLDQATLLKDMQLQVVKLAEGEEKHVVLGGSVNGNLTIKGRLMHRGQGVENGMLTFMASGSKQAGNTKFTTTDAGGSFSLELGQPGDYLVTAQMSVGIGKQEAVETKANFQPTEEGFLEWVFELPEGGIEGRVLDADGEPLAGTRVSLKVDGGAQTGSIMGGHFAETSTQEDGSYAFKYLSPGMYQVAAGGAILGGALGGSSEHGRQVRSGVQLAGSASLKGIDFQLAASGTLAGIVRDASGQPVADAALFVRTEEGRLVEPFSMTASDAAGRFRMPGLNPGRYTVSAQKGSQVSLESALVTVPAGEVGSIEVALGPGTMLYVSVLDDQGAALDASISVRDPEGREYAGRQTMQAIMESMQAGIAGEELAVGPLPPGDYSITATAADGLSKSKELTLGGQPERRLKLHMR